MDKLVPINLPPGMRNTGTRYQSKNRWYTGNFVRFFQDTIQPIGGWTKVALSGATITGVPNAAVAFIGADSTGATRHYIGLGTSTGKLYVINTDSNVVYDITPSWAGPFTHSAGSFVVGVWYKIATVGTTDFTLVGASANTVGVEFVATGAGSGSGTATYFYDAVWQLAVFGRYLVASLGYRDVIDNGNAVAIWYGTTAAAAVATDPSSTATIGGSFMDAAWNCQACVVTPERFLLALRGNTPRNTTVNPIWLP